MIPVQVTFQRAISGIVGEGHPVREFGGGDVIVAQLAGVVFAVDGEGLPAAAGAVKVENVGAYLFGGYKVGQVSLTGHRGGL